MNTEKYKKQGRDKNKFINNEGINPFVQILLNHVSVGLIHFESHCDYL